MPSNSNAPTWTSTAVNNVIGGKAQLTGSVNTALCSPAPNNWGAHNLSLLQQLEDALQHHISPEELPKLRRAKRLLDAKIDELTALRKPWPALRCDSTEVLSTMISMHCADERLCTDDCATGPLDTRSLVSLAATCHHWHKEVADNVRVGSGFTFSEAIGRSAPRMLASTFPRLIELSLFEPVTPEGVTALEASIPALVELQVLFINFGRTEREQALMATVGQLWRSRQARPQPLQHGLTASTFDYGDDAVEAQFLESRMWASVRSRTSSNLSRLTQLCAQGCLPALKYFDAFDDGDTLTRIPEPPPRALHLKVRGATRDQTPKLLVSFSTTTLTSSIHICRSHLPFTSLLAAPQRPPANGCLVGSGAVFTRNVSADEGHCL